MITQFKNQAGEVWIVDGDLNLMAGDPVVYEQGFGGQETRTLYEVKEVRKVVDCISPERASYKPRIEVDLQVVEE